MQIIPACIYLSQTQTGRDALCPQFPALGSDLEVDQNKSKIPEKTGKEASWRKQHESQSIKTHLVSGPTKFMLCGSACYQFATC